MEIVEKIKRQDHTSCDEDKLWHKLNSLQKEFTTLSNRIDLNIKAEKELRKLLPQTRRYMEKLRKMAITIMELKQMAAMITVSPPPNDLHQQQAKRIETDMEDENNKDHLKQYIAKAG